MKSIGVGLVALVVLALLVSCEDDAAVQVEHPAAARARELEKKKAEAKKKTALVMATAVEVPEKEEWQIIAPLFESFRPAKDMRKDIFMSRLDKFNPPDPKAVAALEAMDAKDEEPGAEAEADRTEKAALEGLRMYGADEFKVVAILSGLGVPRAILRDPKGGTHMVKVDTLIGNENGKVTAIKQYVVMVEYYDSGSDDTKTEPRKQPLSLEPALLTSWKHQKQEKEKLVADD